MSPGEKPTFTRRPSGTSAVTARSKCSGHSWASVTETASSPAIAASEALGAWYAFGHGALQRLADAATAGDEAVSVTEAQLWPEHFDLAVTADVADGRQVNVGFSPGDTFSAEPYLYVGPHDTSSLDDPFWNAPFGAYVTYEELRGRLDPAAAADGFINRGLAVAAERSSRDSG